MRQKILETAIVADVRDVNIKKNIAALTHITLRFIRHWLFYLTNLLEHGGKNSIILSNGGEEAKKLYFWLTYSRQRRKITDKNPKN